MNVKRNPGNLGNPVHPAPRELLVNVKRNPGNLGNLVHPAYEVQTLSASKGTVNERET